MLAHSTTFTNYLGMLSRKYFACTAILLSLLMLLGYRSYAASNLNYLRYRLPADTVRFPRKIWQTWEVPAQGLADELQRLSKSWIDMNPNYRYELLTSDSALAYVQDNFQDRPDIVHAFEKTQDRILRADVIRYLTLLAEGGVYTDIDTDCSRPIDQWVPAEYANVSNLVIGLEYDAQGGEIRGDFTLPAQLCQWTFMAKPGHPAMQHVVDQVIVKLANLTARETASPPFDSEDVMDTTGPHMFTKAILENLSAQMGHTVTYADISNLVQPKLFGDVLIMPISAFGSGQDHSGSKAWGNDEQLMSHHFLGFQGWKTTHEQHVTPLMQ